MMNRRVVPIEMEYLDQVLKIEQASFKDAWPLSAFRAELEYPWSWFKVVGPLAKGGKLKRLDGYIICWMLPGDLHLLNLAVEPSFRRRGLGRMLLGHALDGFAKHGGGMVSLEVRPSNHAAHGLYYSFGFQVVGHRPGYYRRENEDAVVMALRVVPSEEHPLRSAES